MKSLEPENLDIPIRRLLDVANANSYVINSFKLHKRVELEFRADLTNKKSLMGRDRRARRSVRIVYAVVQFSAPQCVEKCCVVFELVSNPVPNDPRFSVTLRQFRSQNVKGVIDSAALVMHNIIIASNRCPNQAFPWERWVRGGISRVPILDRVRELPLSPTQRATTAGGKSLVE